MTTIYLDASKPYSGFSSVSRLDFPPSKLFVKYTHQPSTNLGNEYLYVYKKYVWYLAAYATIRPTGAYSDASYDYFEVFFNSLDAGLTRPLMLIIHFKNPSRHNKRFILFSRLRDTIDNRASINVPDLDEFDDDTPDDDLVRQLFIENDRIGFISTFVIDYIQINTSYNDGKIKVQNMVYPRDAHYYLMNMGDTIKDAGLMCYSHVPSSNFKSNRCSIVYEDQLLIGTNGLPLYELHGDTYGFINVYWSHKLHLPLLVELNYDRSPDFKHNKFYFIVTSGRSVRWKLLQGDDFTRLTTLKFLHHDTIYNQLFLDATTPVIITLLKQLEFDLFSSIVLFVDIFNGSYGEYDVDRSDGKDNHTFVYKRGRVSVSNIVSKKDGTCLSGTDFRVYEHDFDDIIKNIQYGNPNNIKLKLVTFNIEHFSTDYPTIYIDKKTYMRYMYGSIEILVSDNYNSELNYKWYKHSSESDILKGTFRLEFKDQSVLVNFDGKAHEASPRLVYVYFRRDKDDIFVLVAFPSEDQKQIRYLTYDNFKKNVANQSVIQLSKLPNATASTKSDYYGHTGSRKIDRQLQTILEKEKNSNCVIYLRLDEIRKASYHSESLPISVTQQNYGSDGNYDVVEHKINSRIKFNDISFSTRGSSKILDVTSFFNGENITKVLAYFHKNEPEVPLLIGLFSSKNNRHFKFSEFFYDVNNPVKLSDLEEIKDNDVQSKLKSQFESLNNIVIFKLSSSDNYANVKVTEAKPYGSFKYHIHTPREYFKYIKLEDNNVELADFSSEKYTHEILLDCTVYYHGFDKENKCPLIIEIYTNKVDKRYRAALINPQILSGISGISTFYVLSMIDDRTFKKTYKKINILDQNLTSTLREIYFKFNWKIDPLIGVRGYDAISTFFYKYNKNKLYVYFYKNDPRALAFCYDNQAYKRYFLDGHSSKWTNISGVTSCICNKTRTPGQTQIDSGILAALKEVANFFGLLKPLKPRPEKKLPDLSVQIDLLKKGVNYANSTISVSARYYYTDSDLFCYYSHYRVDRSSFTISSFVDTVEGIKVSNSPTNIINVQSVSIYFNYYDENTPIIIEILYEGSKIDYYEVSKSRGSYTINLNKTITKGPTLCNKLIELNDNINGTFTFQIDKTETYKSINVSLNQNTSNYFTAYSHTLGGLSPNKSFVLYQSRLLVVEPSAKTHSINIQHKKYESIIVYVINADLNYPLLVELKETKTSSEYFFRTDSNGTFKKLDEFKRTQDADIKNKLLETFYLLKKSLVVEINKTVNYNYDIKLIDNKPKLNSLAPSVVEYASAKKSSSLEIIKVLEKKLTCRKPSVGSFKCYQHDLTQSIRTSEVTEISGLRLFSSQNTNDNMTEISLFTSKTTNVENREFIYYLPLSYHGESKSKFNVYFHGNDPRPLLFSFNDRAYVHINGNQWIYDSNVKASSECEILKKLHEIYEKFQGKLVFLKQGEIKNIYTSPNATFGSFFKDSYTPKPSHQTPDKDFKLPKNHLIGTTPTGTNIDKLLGHLYDRAFDTVNVYKSSNRSSLKDILLFEFISDSHRTHIKRKDLDANYWVDEEIKYRDDHELKIELLNIQKVIRETLIYEIDKKKSYSSNIKISEDYVSDREFTKYTHTPSDEGVFRSSLIFYNNEQLFKKVGFQYTQITELDNQEFSSITVYFGSKVTKGNITCPLLIELKDEYHSTQFYSHKRDNVKHYWEDIYTVSSIHTRDLINTLREIQFNLVNSIVLLMDKINDSYGDEEVKRALDSLEPSKEIYLPRLYPKNIMVNRSGQTSSCVNKNGFKMSEHYINTIAGKENCSLRFFIPTSNNKDKYKELRLCDSSGLLNEYSYFRKSHENVHFFYYGDDPRPLLLCYGGGAYMPTNIEDYFEKWRRVDTIGSCLCQSGRENPYLLKALLEVVGILNVVRLEIEHVSPNSHEKAKQPGSISVMYRVHTYGGSDINIRVSYVNGSCYRSYKHEPVGIYDNGNDFRLGNLSFQGRSNILIEYNLVKQLKSVIAYYSLFDIRHEYPLLVILQFSRNEETQFFELNDHRDIKWQPMTGKITDNDIEYRIKQIVDKLGVSLDKSEHAQTLFDRNECYEDSGPSTVTIAGASVGSVVGTAAVSGGVTAAIRPEWFIPVIRALI